MENLGTDRNRYSINLQNMSVEGIIQYITLKERMVVEAQTELEIAWEELRNRGLIQ